MIEFVTPMTFVEITLLICSGSPEPILSEYATPAFAITMSIF